MVKEYKRYGVTTDGYRGERSILKERVIQGFEEGGFTDAVLLLNENSPHTIYLTNSNTADGYYIVLPKANNLWENWQVAVINNSSYDVPIYYYTNDLSNLSLFKTCTMGNMVTCILVDSTSEAGTWTTLRTAEQTSIDQLSQYTSNVFATTQVSFPELYQEQTSVIISLGAIMVGTPVRSVYIKTIEQFTGVNNLTVSVGTASNPTKFIDSYSLTNTVEDNNFTKDYFEEILSNTNAVEIFATFTGDTNLSNLTAGTVNIVVEKAKLIDPTNLVNPIVQTQLPIGVIMNYAFNDVPEGYWRLDGTIVPNAASAIPQFVEKLNEVNNSLTGEKLIVTETVWQNTNNTYGSVGKFAWVGSGLRFPKIANFIQGVGNNLADLSKLIPAGLPTISHYHVIGNYNYGSNNGWFTTNNAGRYAQMPTGGGTVGWNGSGNGGSYSAAGAVTGNQTSSLNVIGQSKVDGLFGKSSTVQPQSIKFPYIISIYNKIQNAASIDLENLLEDSVYKANTNLDNLTDEGIVYLDNRIVNIGRTKFAAKPNYNSVLSYSNNTDYNLNYDVWLFINTQLYNARGYIWINGIQYELAGYDNDDGHGSSCVFFIPAGTTFRCDRGTMRGWPVI